MYNIFYRYIFIISVVFCSSLFASSDLQTQLTAKFEAKLELLINKMNSQRAKPIQEQSINDIRLLAEQEFVAQWDARSTLLGLLGRSHWEELNKKHQDRLEDVFQDTMTRYFMEAYAHYSGQPIKVKMVKLNKRETKGWLQLLIELDYLPDFQVDVGIIRSKDSWLYRDIRVQGISYINLKRQYFQGTITEHGVERLINELVAKNDNFFVSNSNFSGEK